jgi:hypothetical protein
MKRINPLLTTNNPDPIPGWSLKSVYCVKKTDNPSWKEQIYSLQRVRSISRSRPVCHTELFINRESESWIENIYMSVGVMKQKVKMRDLHVWQTLTL